MKSILLSENEIRALLCLIQDSNACSSTCAYNEMITSDKECDECDYNEGIRCVCEKLEGLLDFVEKVLHNA